MEKVIISIEADTSKAVKGVKDLNKSVTETNKTATKTGKGLTGAFKGFGNAITGALPLLGKLKTALISTGVGAIVVALGSLVALFKSAADIGSDFQKSLSSLSAVTGKTADELSVLNQQARELGATTQFTAIEVVGLQTELAKLGFTIKDIENSTPAILDLASSLEVDLASAAELAGSVVRSFGLTTKDTQKVVDVMSLSTSASALNFEALRESLKVVAPASRATGVSVEKTAALLGVLANNGLKGSVAGTGLAKTFIELNKKGITLEDGMEKVKNSTNKLNTAIDLVGQVGAKSFLSLAESGEQINKLEKDFEGAEGAAKKMAEVRLDNLEGDTTKLSSAWEGFLLGLEDGDGIINKLQRGAIQLLTKGISGLGVAIDYLSFIFSDAWTNIKGYVSSGTNVIKGQFQIIHNTFKLLVNGALLQFSKIPIIGKAIDKASVEANIKDAKEQILKGAKSIEDGFNEFRKVSDNVATTQIRFNIRQIQKIKKKAADDELKETKKALELKIANDKKLSEEEIERLKKEREELAKIDAKTKKQAEDLEDKTELEKAERKRERALKELEAVELSEKEKREAKKRINDYYDTVEEDAKLKDEEKAKQKAEEDSKIAAEKLVLDKEQSLLSFDEQRALISEREGLLKEDTIINNKDRLRLTKQFSDAKIKIDELEAKAQKKRVADTSKALDTLSDVVGKNTVAGKGMSIAAATINTYQGVTDALAAKTITPFETALKFVNAAGILSNGLKTVKQITSVKIPNTSGGSGTGGASAPSGGSLSVPSAPPAFNVVGASDTSQLADAIGGQSQQPTRAYVVSADVTTSQEMDRNTIEGASI